MAEKLVQVGRMATPLLLAERGTLYVITDVQDDRMVVVQDVSGERKLFSVGQLHLLDEVLEIDTKMSRAEVSKKMRREEKAKAPESDFERFKRQLREEVEEELLKSKGL